MDFRDPRRSEASRQKRETYSLQSTPVGIIKSAALSALLGLGGLRLTGRYLGILDDLERSAEKAKASQYRAMATIFARKDEEDLSLVYDSLTRDILDTERIIAPQELDVDILHGDRYAEFLNTGRKSDTPLVMDELEKVDATSFDEALQPIIGKTDEAAGEFNRYISEFSRSSELSPAESAELLSKHRSIDELFDRRYPDIRRLIEEKTNGAVKAEVSLEYGGLHPDGFRLTLKDAVSGGGPSRSMWVSLPYDFRHLASEATRYSSNFGTTLVNGVPVAIDPRTKLVKNVSTALDTWLNHPLQGETSLARQIARHIRAQVSMGTDNYLGDVNELAASLVTHTKDMTYRDVLVSIGYKARNISSAVMRSMHGKKLDVIEPAAGGKIVRQPGWSVIRVRQAAEEQALNRQYAAIEYDVYGSRINVGRFDVRLENVAAGMPLRDRGRRAILDQIAKFGYINDELLRIYEEAGIRTTIPGDLITTVVDFTGKPLTGKGGQVTVARNAEAITPLSAGRPFRRTLQQVAYDKATGTYYRYKEDKGLGALFTKLKALKAAGKPLVIEPGQLLGRDADTGEEVFSKGYVHVSQIVDLQNGNVTISGKEEVIAKDGLKEASTKVMTNQLYDREEFWNHIMSLKGMDPDEFSISKYVYYHAEANAIANLMDGDAASKLHVTNRMGMGIHLQMLSDVAHLMSKDLWDRDQLHLFDVDPRDLISRKKLREVKGRLMGVLRAFLGEDAASEIKDLHFTSNGNVVPVLAKGKSLIEVGFDKFRPLEDKVAEAIKGNTGPLNSWVKEAEGKLTEVLGREIRLSGSVRSVFNQAVSDMPPPLFMFDRYGEGQKLLAYKAKISNLVHRSGMAPVANFATFNMTKGHFPGGSKITWERARNAAAYGQYAYYRYLLSTIQVQNSARFEELFEARYAPLLSYRRFKKLGAKAKEINLKSILATEGDESSNLMTMLASIDITRSAKAEAIRLKRGVSMFSMLGDDLQDDELSKLMGTVTGLAPEKLDDMALSGMRGNSVVFIHDDVRTALMNELDNLPKGVQGYLRLPFAISDAFNPGARVTHVPLYRLYDSDFYGITSTALDRYYDRSTVGSRERFHTGNQAAINRTMFLHRIASIQQEIERGNVDEDRRKELERATRTAVDEYHQGLDIGGKNSISKRLLTEAPMPLSAKGIIYHSDEMKFGYVGMTKDHLVKMYSNGTIDDYSQLLQIREGYLTEQRYTVSMEEIAKNLGADDAKIASPEYRKHLISMKHMIDDIRANNGAPRDNTGSALKLFNSVLNEAKRASGLAPDAHVSDEDLIKVLEGAEPGSRVMRKVESFRKAVRKTSNFSVRVRSHKSDLRVVADTIFSLIEHAEAGKTVPGRFQGSPELNIQSGAVVKLQVIDPKRTSALGRLISKHLKESGDVMFFMSKETGRIIGRDADRDTASVIGLSFRELRKFTQGRGKHRLDRFFHEIGMDVKDRNGRPYWNRFMNDEFELETVTAMLDRVAIAEEQLGNGEVKYYPTNSSSFEAMALANDAGTTRRRQVMDADEAITGVLRDSGYEEGEIKKILPTLRSRYEEGSRSLNRSKAGLTVKFLTDVNGRLRDESLATDTFMKEQAEQERLKGVLSLSKGEALVRKTREAVENEAYHQYVRDVEGPITERYIAIKGGTPVAYPPSAVIIDVMGTMKLDERERSYLSRMAHSLAQDTISSKHGTPLYVEDLVRKLKQLADPKVTNVDETIDDIVRGKLTVRVSDSEAKSMLHLGYLTKKTEPVSYAQYAGYMKEELSFYSDVLEAHKRAEKTLAERLNRLDEDRIKSANVEKLYREEFERHISLMDTDVPGGLLTPYHEGEGVYRKGGKAYLRSLRSTWRSVPDSRDWYDIPGPDDYVHTELPLRKYATIAGEMTTPELFALRKKAGNLPEWAYGRLSVTRYVDTLREMEKHNLMDKITTEFFSDEAERRGHLRKLVRGFREYSSIRGGESAFNDPYTKMFTSVKGSRRATIMQRVREYADNPGTGQLTTLDHIMASGAASVREMENLKNLSERKHLPGTAWSNERAIKASESVGRIHEASFRAFRDEINTLERMKRRAMETQSTPYRNHSLISTLTGKLNRVGASVETDLAERYATRLKGRALLAGAIGGFILGQSLNLEVGKYAVPDLGEPKGLGGEYYENVNGIMGREMEIMLRPRPPRVIPERADASQGWKDYASALNRQAAVSVMAGDRTFVEDNRFVGGVVR